MDLEGAWEKALKKNRNHPRAGSVAADADRHTRAVCFFGGVVGQSRGYDRAKRRGDRPQAIAYFASEYPAI